MIKAFSLKKIITFLVTLLTPLAVGGLSALVTGDMSSIYDTVVTPPFAPPAIVFPIVWTILYTLMGIALYLVVKDGMDDSEVKEAVLYFAVTLVLNFFWTPIFFKWGKVLLALIWLGAMIILAGINIVQFYRINKWSGILLIPYFIWLLFAFALNLAIYLLNGPQI